MRLYKKAGNLSPQDCFPYQNKVEMWFEILDRIRALNNVLGVMMNSLAVERKLRWK